MGDPGFTTSRLTMGFFTTKQMVFHIRALLEAAFRSQLLYGGVQVGSYLGHRNLASGAEGREGSESWVSW